MSELDRLRHTYFEECSELLDNLQDSLAVLEDEQADVAMQQQAIAAAFRVAHSIKGGAGAFGNEGLVSFAHALEAVLEAVRNNALTVTAEVAALLLHGGDTLASLVEAARDNLPLPAETGENCLLQLRALVRELVPASSLPPAPLQAGLLPPAAPAPGRDVDFPVVPAFASPPPPAVAPAPALPPGADVDFPVIPVFSPPAPPKAPPPPAPPAAAPAEMAPAIASPRRTWALHYAPTTASLAAGNEPLHIFRSLKALGGLSLSCNSSDLPPLSRLSATDCLLSWDLSLSTSRPVEDIAESFAFVAPLCPPELGNDLGERYLIDSQHPQPVRLVSGQPEDHPPGLAAAPPTAETGQPLSPFPEDASADNSPASPAITGSTGGVPTGATAGVTTGSDTLPPAGLAASTVAPATTIRVDVDRIDRLMNMVGELVITQAMLAQQALALAQDRFPMLFQGLEDLAHHTRDIQESVMAIRAQPVKTVFTRLPRLVRETALATGKRVRLHLHGEETEVDKSVVEGLADPLTHLIRNAIDHGIESPRQRLAHGKSEEGIVAVSAEHRSGRIVIQVADDGAGINRETIVRKAIEKGLLPAGAGTPAHPLGEDEIDELIFHPGFSTADLVSNISGRGVGMDVVRSNVAALGGRIQVRSQAGRGTVFALTLPLTLAVMDGMILRVGNETYVLPIANIVESVRPTAGMVHQLVGRGPMLLLRGQYFPLICLSRIFSCEGGETDPTHALVVLAEGEDGARVALVVDQLVGQQQVVIKSLERNYGQLEGISAATILGDGRVALILDVARLRVMAARRLPACGQTPGQEQNTGSGQNNGQAPGHAGRPFPNPQRETP